ncbi:MAG: UvrD-helicase domain-containing protein [Chroococcales cyanobacterium]
MAKVLEKIQLLRDNPKTQGNLKKRLHGYQGKVYRLRCGDYRIIYSYGDGWVSLLGVDQRKDVYKGTKLVADSPNFEVNQLPSTADLLALKPTSKASASSAKSDALPRKLDETFLKQLRIPNQYFSALRKCHTLDDLTTAKIPDSVRDRVFDALTTPNFDQVLTQPNLVTGSTDDLLQFKQGNVLEFLLKLNPEQEKYVNWALNAKGPTLLKGGPGTGKSTVALYRVKALLDDLLAQDLASPPKILFTTYTNALVSFSEQLLEKLLGKNCQYVEVETVDAIALQLFKQKAHHSPNFANTYQQIQFLKEAITPTIATLSGNKLQQQAQQKILERLSVNYLLEEINSVIEARGITDLETYLATPRNGREVPLNKTQRKAIWNLRESFYQILTEKGLKTWQQLRSEAVGLIPPSPPLKGGEQKIPPSPPLKGGEQKIPPSPPLKGGNLMYDAVVVDEAQDLDPNALRLLTLLCSAPNRLFITADANQSIYGSSFRWQNVHHSLNFTGRTGTLKRNHRTTKEINEAAHSYLSEGILDPEDNQREYVHTGPPPAVRAVNNTEDEAALLTQFCRRAVKEFRLGISSCAILVPTEKAGKRIANVLSYQGLATKFMSSQELDIQEESVKVLTLKAAKGLEFPICAIAGFLDSPFPYIPQHSSKEAKLEIYKRERRSLFVAMTRAMRGLLVIIPAENNSPILRGFDANLWNMKNH